MLRGIRFDMPNEHGSLLGEVLKPVDITAFNWRIGSGESYLVENGQLDQKLFPEEGGVIAGADLKKRVETNKYYIIFADLQAFPKGDMSQIETFEEYMDSTCEMVLLVVDCSDVTIYCKNQEAIELLSQNAVSCGFENIETITDENDTRTRLSVW